MTTHAIDSELLRRSLGSVLEQSMPDFELIVVVDGNIGEAEEELAVAARDPRVRIQRPGRVGRGAALNLGLAAARAELIAIQDSDDESHPLRLERQVSVFKQRPDIDLLATGAILTSSPSLHADWDISEYAGDISTIDRELLSRNVLFHTSVLARSTLFDELGGYNAALPRLLDYDLYLRAREAHLKIARLEIPLVLSRQHVGQWFAGELSILGRSWQALRLQRPHIRELPFFQRWWFTAMSALRIMVRFGRSHLTRKRLQRARRRDARAGRSSPPDGSATNS